MDVDLFADSDTDYADIEKEGDKILKKPLLVASPKISKQLLRNGSPCDNVRLSRSPLLKSPRNLKQQLIYKSPRKKVIKSLDFSSNHHVPLTLEKKRDPSHVPYYLLNFECILRYVAHVQLIFGNKSAICFHF